MEYINTKTPFEKEHFDPASITIAQHSIDIQKLLGFHLDDLSIKRLSGAPTTSTIEVIYKSQWTLQELQHEKAPPGLYFLVNNASYLIEPNAIGIFHDNFDGAHQNRLGIYIKLIAFKKTAPRKIAARMLAVIVREALAIPGLARIRLLAAGGRRWSPLDRSTGERWGGYVAWPTYGFDMELLPRTKSMATHFRYWPPEVEACQTVSAILQTAGGREYWKTVGDGWYMDFDLSSTRSASLRTLNEVLEKAML